MLNSTTLVCLHKCFKLINFRVFDSTTFFYGCVVLLNYKDESYTSIEFAKMTKKLVVSIRSNGFWYLMQTHYFLKKHSRAITKASFILLQGIKCSIFKNLSTIKIIQSIPFYVWGNLSTNSIDKSSYIFLGIVKAHIKMYYMFFFWQFDNYNIFT